MDDAQEKLKQHAVERAKPEVSQEKVEIAETGRALEHEDLQKAKEIVESMQIDDNAKAQTHAAAQQVQPLDQQEKLKKLMAFAKDKGVVYAVKVAQKMNDPYLLDMLHDLLAQNGYYKEFLK